MHYVLLIALSLSASALAAEDLCPGAKVVGSYETTVCFGNEGAATIFKLAIDKKHKAEYAEIKEHADKVVFYDAFELGLLPDADIDLLYSYNYFLKSKKKVAGYADLSVYRNAETGARYQVVSKYNLKGQLASYYMKDVH